MLQKFLAWARWKIHLKRKYNLPKEKYRTWLPKILMGWIVGTILSWTGLADR